MLSNTAIPKYYGAFREKVIAGKIPVCREVSMEMNRIDALIQNPGVYYDDQAVEGFIEYCENELTLTDGSKVTLLDSFKLWAEQIFGWYYYIERSVFVPDDRGGHYVTKRIRKRLINKQYLIIPRSNAKSMYASFIQSFFLNIDTSTTKQITVAPTMKQADEVMSPIRTSITRARGPYFKMLTSGSVQSRTNTKAMLAATKKGIQNFTTGSFIEVRPMSIDKLQGLQVKCSTIDEWLSGDIREDVIGAVEQGAAKVDDYLILAVSSEGNVRNGPGDNIKLELTDILKGDYNNPHVSIWWYKMDDIKEIGDENLWEKANPNINRTVSYETLQLEVERMEKVPSSRNDILAKRFSIPMEGYTYYFTYEETLVHRFREYWNMPCSLGIDLSQGDDFCSFTFMFPLSTGEYGIKTRNYITSSTYQKLSLTMKQKYDDFVKEGNLIILNGTVLNLTEVYEDLIEHIEKNGYDVRCVGYDPYNATSFMDRWIRENGEFGVEVVRQGVKTESVPLGEIKKLAEDRLLLFDEALMQFAMGNCIALEDTNGNRKLYKKRREEKIDAVAALLDAFVAYKLNMDAFE